MGTWKTQSMVTTGSITTSMTSSPESPEAGWGGLVGWLVGGWVGGVVVRGGGNQEASKTLDTERETLVPTVFYSSILATKVST